MPGNGPVPFLAVDATAIGVRFIVAKDGFGRRVDSQRSACADGDVREMDESNRMMPNLDIRVWFPVGQDRLYEIRLVTRL